MAEKCACHKQHSLLRTASPRLPPLAALASLRHSPWQLMGRGDAAAGRRLRLMGCSGHNRAAELSGCSLHLCRAALFASYRKCRRGRSMPSLLCASWRKLARLRLGAPRASPQCLRGTCLTHLARPQAAACLAHGGSASHKRKYRAGCHAHSASNKQIANPQTQSGSLDQIAKIANRNHAVARKLAPERHAYCAAPPPRNVRAYRVAASPISLRRLAPSVSRSAAFAALFCAARAHLRARSFHARNKC